MTGSPGAPATIAKVVQDYLDGMVFAVEAKLVTVPHPRWRCIGNFAGGLE